MGEGSHVDKEVNEVLEIGTDDSVKPVGKALLVGNAGEEFPGDDDVGVGNGDSFGSMSSPTAINHRAEEYGTKLKEFLTDRLAGSDSDAVC